MRFGLIGTGRWAETVHAPSLARHPNVEFARGCHLLLEKPIATSLIDARRLEVDVAQAGDRGHPCDVQFGARIVQVLDAAQRSLTNACRVELAYV
jgi:hypothetical protein